MRPLDPTDDWQRELARVQVDRLPAAARRAVLELVDRFRQEDLANKGSAAYSGTRPSSGLRRR